MRGPLGLALTPQEPIPEHLGMSVTHLRGRATVNHSGRKGPPPSATLGKGWSQPPQPHSLKGL